MKKKAFSLTETMILIIALAALVAISTPVMTRKAINTSEAGATISGGSHGRYEIFTKEILTLGGNNYEKTISDNPTGKIRVYRRLTDAEFETEAGRVPGVKVVNEELYKELLYEEINDAEVIRNHSGEIESVKFDSKTYSVGANIVIESADLVYAKGKLEKTTPKNFTPNGEFLDSDERIIEGNHTVKYGKNSNGNNLWHLQLGNYNYEVTPIPWERIISGGQIIKDGPVKEVDGRFVGAFNPGPNAKNLVVHAVGGGGAGGGINEADLGGTYVTPKNASPNELKEMQQVLAKRFKDLYDAKKAKLSQSNQDLLEEIVCGKPAKTDCFSVTNIVGVTEDVTGTDVAREKFSSNNLLRNKWIVLNKKNSSITVKFDARVGLILPHELLDYTYVLGSSTQNSVVYDMPKWFDYGDLDDYCLVSVGCGEKGYDGPKIIWENIPFSAYDSRYCVRKKYAGGSDHNGDHAIESECTGNGWLSCYTRTTPASDEQTDTEYQSCACGSAAENQTPNAAKIKDSQLKALDGMPTGFASTIPCERFQGYYGWCTRPDTKINSVNPWGVCTQQADGTCTQARQVKKTVYESCDKYNEQKCVEKICVPYKCQNEYYDCIPGAYAGTSSRYKDIILYSSFWKDVLTCPTQEIDPKRIPMTAKYLGGAGGAAPACGIAAIPIRENQVSRLGYNCEDRIHSADGKVSGGFGLMANKDDDIDVPFTVGRGKSCTATAGNRTAISAGGSDGDAYAQKTYTYDAKLQVDGCAEDDEDCKKRVAKNIQILKNAKTTYDKYKGMGKGDSIVNFESGYISFTIDKEEQKKHTKFLQEMTTSIAGAHIVETGAKRVKSKYLFGENMLCAAMQDSPPRGNKGADGQTYNSIHKDCKTKLSGIPQTSGKYNYIYSWTIPYATNMLTYGESGKPGEYKTATIAKANGDIQVVLGKGGVWNDIEEDWKKDGNQGPSGTDTIVSVGGRKFLTAQGGQGGRQSQMTDRYDLCYAEAGICGSQPCCNKENGTRSTKDIRSASGHMSAFDNIISSIVGNSKVIGIGAGRSGDGPGTRAGHETIYGTRKSYNITSVKNNGSEQILTKFVENPGDTHYKNYAYRPSGHNFKGGDGAVIITW